MESLFNLGKEYLGWLLTLVMVIVVLVIGHKMDITKKQLKEREKLDQRKAEAEKKKMFLKDMSPTLLARHLRTHLIETINIYYSPRIHFGLHKKMIDLIKEHLVKIGYRNGMSDIDQIAMQHWINPVLVICPSLQTFMYHNDQKENRTKSLSMTIETSDINYLIHEVDNAIAILGVKDENTSLNR